MRRRERIDQRRNGWDGFAINALRLELRESHGLRLCRDAWMLTRCQRWNPRRLRLLPVVRTEHRPLIPPKILSGRWRRIAVLPP